MYNRDLVADLFKIANTILEEINYSSKVKRFSLSIDLVVCIFRNYPIDHLARLHLHHLME
jgi:hypothetical protein